MLTRLAESWRRMSTPRKIRFVVMRALLLIGIWALTPYFFSRQIDEMFPAAQSGAAAAAPRPLLRGSFTRVDAIHAAEGTATLLRQPDGRLILRLEDFKSTNGPDLVVGLSAHPMPRSRGDVHDQGYLQIQSLKANEGNQNYELPADADPSKFRSVVIYCRTFSVVFSSAELTTG